jgi:hypothetical protein
MRKEGEKYEDWQARCKRQKEEEYQREIKKRAKRRVDLAAEVERVRDDKEWGVAFDKAKDLARNFRPTSGSAQAAKPSCRDWLVEGLIVEGEPMMLAGPKKCYKTSFAVDLAVSLATSTPFLGRFAVPPLSGSRPRLVTLASGESGTGTLGETLRRVAESRGIDPASLNNLNIVPAVPNFSDRASMVAFERAASFIVKNEGQDSDRRLVILDHNDPEANEVDEGDLRKPYSLPPDVYIIDPLYQALCDVNTADLSAVGELLTRAYKEHFGKSVIYVHHTAKHTYGRKQLDLDALAFAGVSEYTRQWFLINWRALFKADEPRRFMVNYGGSAGHSGEFALDLDEGKLNADFTGRTWKTTIRDLTEAKQEDKASTRRAKQGSAAVSHADALLAVLPADGSKVSYNKSRLAA